MTENSRALNGRRWLLHDEPGFKRPACAPSIQHFGGTYRPLRCCLDGHDHSAEAAGPWVWFSEYELHLIGLELERRKEPHDLLRREIERIKLAGGRLADGWAAAVPDATKALAKVPELTAEERRAAALKRLEGMRR